MASKTISEILDELMRFTEVSQTSSFSSKDMQGILDAWMTENGITLDGFGEWTLYDINDQLQLVTPNGNGEDSLLIEITDAFSTAIAELEVAAGLGTAVEVDGQTVYVHDLKDDLPDVGRDGEVDIFIYDIDVARSIAANDGIVNAVSYINIENFDPLMDKLVFQSDTYAPGGADGDNQYIARNYFDDGTTHGVIIDEYNDSSAHLPGVNYRVQGLGQGWDDLFNVEFSSTPVNSDPTGDLEALQEGIPGAGTNTTLSPIDASQTNHILLYGNTEVVGIDPSLYDGLLL